MDVTKPHEKEYNVFSANFAPWLRFVSIVPVHPRCRPFNRTLSPLPPLSLFFFSSFHDRGATKKRKNFFHVVRTNVASLDRVPGIQWELLFTSEQHDDGALKISRRKSPAATGRSTRADVYENRTLNETDLPSGIRGFYCSHILVHLIDSTAYIYIPTGENILRLFTNIIFILITEKIAHLSIKLEIF